MLRLPDSVLGRPAQPVGVVDDRALSLAADLIDTMVASPACVGLAAPQIGVGLRAFVVDVSGHKKAPTAHGRVVMFDPVVVHAEGEVRAREGCMSVPDLTGDVVRPGRITVRGMGLDGAEITLTVEGFEARAYSHELDHLDGLLFLDRVDGPHSVHRRKVYR